MKRVEFDIGNTNHKWRLMDGNHVVERGTFANTDAQGLSAIPVEGLEAIWLSCVGADTFVSSIKEWADSLSVPVEQAVVTSTSAGIRCAYSEPERLGVDRWLVTLAAFHRFGASCIVDIGSALTVDVVDDLGKHLGGYIVPGYQLMIRSLFKDTDKVRWSDNEVNESISSDVSLGQNTASAVLAGVKLMLIGFIEQAKRHLPIDNATMVFTGGGAVILRDACEEGGELLEDLVFEGAAICSEAENMKVVFAMLIAVVVNLAIYFYNSQLPASSLAPLPEVESEQIKVISPTKQL